MYFCGRAYWTAVRNAVAGSTRFAESDTAATESEVTKLAIITKICLWSNYLATSINIAYS
jgi:hypothetical protein